MSQNNFFL